MTVRLRARLGEGGWNSTILDWGDDTSRCFRLFTRRAGEDREDFAWDDTQQNYLSFPAADGTCDVLEAEVAFRNHNPDWNRMRIGVPAARIGKGRTYEIVLRFTGPSLGLYVDGVLVDEDWPLGEVPTSPSALKIGDPGFGGAIERVEVWPCALSDADIVKYAGGPGAVAEREIEILGPENPRAQYWTPRGYNQWVGDVMLGDLRQFDEQRFDVFYLIDRAHGARKFNRGGHFIAHMSSTDLKHWRQHPLAVAIEPWETIGTGQPVVHDGKVVLVYGLHSGRIMPESSTVHTEIDAQGCTVPQRFPDGERYPEGTSFAESEDGIHFKKSGWLVHPAQNPSVCRDAGGTGFLMLAGFGSRGLWHSEDLRLWQSIDPGIVPVNFTSPVRNTNECQCLFEWNGWHYILSGRTGFWMSRDQRGPYWEGKDGKNTGLARPRWDVYDGLMVPMVAPFGESRRILAGNLQGLDVHWGGHLVFRELIQFADGTLGTKWPEEMVPPVRAAIEPELRIGRRKSAGRPVSVSGSPSSWAEIAEAPRQALLSLRMAGAKETALVSVALLDGENKGCSLSMLPRQGRVQWNTVAGLELPPPVPTLADVLAEDERSLWQIAHEVLNPHMPFFGHDFAIEHVEGLNKPFGVELFYFYDRKSRSTIIDACINGHRTMITRRKGLAVRTIRLAADGKCDFLDIRLGEVT
ncbi:MAG: hypothetical protein JXR37_28765 [Kiritimatiellae bacterium]|nr:hypothetical protein [Kiritimatiellia bacterium]